MLLHILIFSLFLVLLPAPLPVASAESDTFMQEDFDSLDNWDPVFFPRVQKHTMYSVVKEGQSSYLKAESNASASAISSKREFNVYEYAYVRWKWKVRNVYRKGDASRKSGDDYPLRIYFAFKYDPEKASFGERIKYGFAKRIFGQYPPRSGLNYIWANRRHEQRIITSTYAKEERMIILQSGSDNAGKWIEQKVNIIEDYRRAFGSDPPSNVRIVIMNDADDTGEGSVSYIDYLIVYR